MTLKLKEAIQVVNVCSNAFPRGEVRLLNVIGRNCDMLLKLIRADKDYMDAAEKLTEKENKLKQIKDENTIGKLGEDGKETVTVDEENVKVESEKIEEEYKGYDDQMEIALNREIKYQPLTFSTHDCKAETSAEVVAILRLAGIFTD
jgi:hypothetical protein